MSSFRCFLWLLFAILNVAVLPFVGANLAEINIAIVTPRQSKANGETLLYGNQGLVSALLAIETINNKSDGYFDNVLPNTTLKFDFMIHWGWPNGSWPRYNCKKEGLREWSWFCSWRRHKACTMAHLILKHFEILQVSPASTSGFLLFDDYPHFQGLYQVAKCFRCNNKIRQIQNRVGEGCYC